MYLYNWTSLWFDPGVKKNRPIVEDFLDSLRALGVGCHYRWGTIECTRTVFRLWLSASVYTLCEDSCCLESANGSDVKTTREQLPFIIGSLLARVAQGWTEVSRLGSSYLCLLSHLSSHFYGIVRCLGRKERAAATFDLKTIIALGVHSMNAWWGTMWILSQLCCLLALGFLASKIYLKSEKCLRLRTMGKN